MRKLSLGLASVLAVLICTGSCELFAQPSSPRIVHAAAIIPSEQLLAIARTLTRDVALDSLHSLYAARGYLAPSIRLTADSLVIDEGRRYDIAAVWITPDSLAASIQL